MNNIIRSTSFCLCLNTALAIGQSNVLTYEGQFEDLNGNPITEPIEFEFSFWNAEVGGSQLTEFVDLDEDVIPYQGGFVTTFVGDEPDLPVPMEIFGGEAVYLNVRANGEDLTPRKLITSVPQAAHATSASNLTITKQVAPGETIDAGDFVTLNTTNQRLYKGFCSEIPEEQRPIPLAVAEWEFDREMIFIHDKRQASVGYMSGDVFEWTDPALFTVVDGFRYIDSTPLSSNSLLISYLDPFDQVYVVKKATFSGRTLTIDNQNLCLFAAGNANGSIDLEALSPNSFVAVYSAKDGNSSKIYKNVVTILENGFQKDTPTVLMENLQGDVAIAPMMGDTYYLAVLTRTTYNFTTFTSNQTQLINPLSTRFGTFAQSYQKLTNNDDNKMINIGNGIAILQYNRISSAQRELTIDSSEVDLPNIRFNGFGSPGTLMNSFDDGTILINTTGGVSYYKYNPEIFPFLHYLNMDVSANCSKAWHRIGENLLFLRDNFVYSVNNPIGNNFDKNKLNLGVALKSASNEETIPVSLSGVVSVYDSLTPGQFIYFDYYGETTYNSSFSRVFNSHLIIDETTIIYRGQ